jgi:hypothetical protein
MIHGITRYGCSTMTGGGRVVPLDEKLLTRAGFGGMLVEDARAR